MLRVLERTHGCLQLAKICLPIKPNLLFLLFLSCLLASVSSVAIVECCDLEYVEFGGFFCGFSVLAWCGFVICLDMSFLLDLAGC